MKTNPRTLIAVAALALATLGVGAGVAAAQATEPAPPASEAPSDQRQDRDCPWFGGDSDAAPAAPTSTA